MINRANLLLLLIAILLAVASFNWHDKNLLKTVQAGDKTLACEFKDGGWRVVEPALVVDFIDGVWAFKNGHAKNCEVK